MATIIFMTQNFANRAYKDGLFKATYDFWSEKITSINKKIEKNKKTEKTEKTEKEN